MSMINILVLENNSSLASSMKINLNKWGRVNVTLFKKIGEATKYVEVNAVDLIIARPTIKDKDDGIDFCRKVSNGLIPLIFISDSENNQPYKKMRGLNILSFLIRPFEIKALYATLNVYFNSVENFLIINKGKEKIRVRYHNIDWIRSAGNYAMIRTDSREYAMKISLSKLKESFLDNNFIQIHRAFIIRIDKVDDINMKMNSVNIKGTQIPIGRKYRKGFFDRIEII